MKVISIVAQKGEICKTTMTVSLAAFSGTPAETRMGVISLRPGSCVVGEVLLSSLTCSLAVPCALGAVPQVWRILRLS